MTIRVLIKRKVVPGNELTLADLLTRLRTLALQARGYISGETLHALEDVNESLVISTWETLEDWRAWEANAGRRDLQAKIDRLLVYPSEHRVMLYGA
jgi:heme-degrading monooxygenase HmoA